MPALAAVPLAPPVSPPSAACPPRLVPRVPAEAFDYATIGENAAPLVLAAMDLGPCTAKWQDPAYLGRAHSGLVSIHVSDKPAFNFVRKSFSYSRLDWAAFIDSTFAGPSPPALADPSPPAPRTYQYLRSLAAVKPLKRAANFPTDFPALASDLRLPEGLDSLLTDPAKAFSSVLRISSAGLTLWTHYDVMDNVLLQVVGSKRVLLFAPHWVESLGIEGSSSRHVLNLPAAYGPAAWGARWECTLHPGDALLIPAFWFHNVTSLTPAVSVNLFYRNPALESVYGAARDLYGNRDLEPYLQSLDVLEALWGKGPCATNSASPAGFVQVAALISDLILQDGEEGESDNHGDALSAPRHEDFSPDLDKALLKIRRYMGSLSGVPRAFYLRKLRVDIVYKALM